MMLERLIHACVTAGLNRCNSVLTCSDDLKMQQLFILILFTFKGKRKTFQRTYQQKTVTHKSQSVNFEAEKNKEVEKPDKPYIFKLIL